ncbi:unnamed protein product [Ascophyllum nodosum]
MPADYTQCRVRKQSNECESEKRLAKSQRSGVALTEYGARGALAGRALPTSTACGRNTVLPSGDCINSFAFTIRSPSREHASIIFLGRGWDYINSFAFTIRSPSREHASIILFGLELERNRTWETYFALFLPNAERRLTTAR